MRAAPCGNSLKVGKAHIMFEVLPTIWVCDVDPPCECASSVLVFEGKETPEGNRFLTNLLVPNAAAILRSALLRQMADYDPKAVVSIIELGARNPELVLQSLGRMPSCIFGFVETMRKAKQMAEGTPPEAVQDSARIVDVSG